MIEYEYQVILEKMPNRFELYEMKGQDPAESHRGAKAPEYNIDCSTP